MPVVQPSSRSICLRGRCSDAVNLYPSARIVSSIGRSRPPRNVFDRIRVLRRVIQPEPSCSHLHWIRVHYAVDHDYT